MCGREAVSQAAGVTVQPAVGVSPDGVVSEQRLAGLPGDLQWETLSVCQSVSGIFGWDISSLTGDWRPQT